MIVEPKVRGFICTTAHPVGLKAAVKEDIDFVRARGAVNAGKTVLVTRRRSGRFISR